MFKKIISEGAKTQQKFLKGIEVVDRMVGNTYGPGGRNRILTEKYRPPLIINDGWNIARRIVLDDEVEDLAAQVIIETARQTADQAGDGTTGTVIMASELTRTCMGLLAEESKKSEFESGNKIHPMALKRQIQEEKDKAIEIIKKGAKKLKDKDLDNIISTSLENLEYGKTLGDLMRTVGQDGYVSVEDNWLTKYGITTETTTGMRFLGSYASGYLATEKNKKEAVWENTHVLVTNHLIETTAIFKELIDGLRAKGVRKLVIIGGYSEGANPFGKQFIEAVSRAVEISAKVPNSDNFLVLAVKAPSLTTDELHDVAAFCGAHFFDKAVGADLKTMKEYHLGFAKKVSATQDEVNIIGGIGETKERIDTLKEQIELEKDPMFKEKLKRRVASLASGVGVIRVGAQTESERRYLKEKIIDAVSAARAAMEEGLVKGAGLALKEAAEELGKDALLYNTLNAPHKRLLELAGDIKIPATVVDPFKVVRLALENACSGAGMLITADGGITEKKMEYADYLEKALVKAWPRDERDDWRDEEQEDYGRNPVRN